MLMLDGIARICGHELIIPDHIRNPLSLKSGTRVYSCVLPSSSGHPRLQSCELIASPISLEHWNQLWKIRVTFRDRPGVVHQFLKVIADLNFNCCIEESSSIDGRRRHTLEVIVNPAVSQPFGTQEAAIADLKCRALAMCINDIEFIGVQPALRIDRMEGLYSAWENYNQVSLGAGTKVWSGLVQKGCLRIPVKVLQWLHSYLGAKRTSAADGLRILLQTDTKERLLRGYFPHQNEALIYLRIGHHDRIGALAEITGALRAHDVDVVTSFTRIQKQGDRSHFDVVVGQRLDRRATSDDDATLWKTVLDALKHPSLHDLDLSILRGAEARTSTEGKRIRAPVHSHTFRVIKRKTEELFVETADLLIQRHEELMLLQRRASSVSGLDKVKIKLLEELLGGIGAKPAYRQVFVSYDFSQRKLEKYASELLTKHGFASITGADSGERERYRDVIIDRIAGSAAFLGIWTPEDNPVRLSPCLIWELAVAQIYKVPVQLVVERNVPESVLDSLLPETHRVTFTMKTFRSEATKAVRFIRERLKL